MTFDPADLLHDLRPTGRAICPSCGYTGDETKCPDCGRRCEPDMREDDGCASKR